MNLSKLFTIVSRQACNMLGQRYTDWYADRGNSRRLFWLHQACCIWSVMIWRIIDL